MVGARCRKLVDHSNPLLLIGPPVDFGGRDTEQARVVLHVAFICELYELQVRRGRYFLHTPSHSAESASNGGSMNRLPDVFQTVTDSCLFGRVMGMA